MNAKLTALFMAVLLIACGAPKTNRADHVPPSLPAGATAPSEPPLIASGGAHACMVTSEKTVACWGDNRYGQLGDGTTTNAAAPVGVAHLGYVATVAAGEWFTCAALATGQVKCWGDNSQWQLGAATPRRSSTPILLSVGPAMRLAAGRTHACAILINGDVTCWGDNRTSQTGVQRGSLAKPSLPVMVPYVVDAIDVAAGEEHSCAVQEDGQLLCWGDNHFGQLGHGVQEHHSFPPGPVPIAGKAMAVAAGRRHTCALLRDRTVQCWGEGFEGQLGDGLRKDSLTPVLVTVRGSTPLERVTAITAGSQHTCALQEGGKVWCWGSNALGQLGRAEGMMADRPVFTGLADAVAVAAGGWHTCALRTGGVTTCVGQMKGKEGDE
jgi:alpha-tubulin suppressor-like RCC1 family protein